MSSQRTVVMARPDCYEVTYTINPWMNPAAWSRERDEARLRAHAQWSQLAERLRGLGLVVEAAPAVAGLPDIVFPANAGIVLDRRALLSRFRYPERRGEEAAYLRFFEDLRDRGILREVRQMPEGVFQEGAGDCIWDVRRRLFWAGHGPRSMAESIAHIRDFFGQRVIGLELATEHFYHLDTCFCVLSGGEVLYYPPAFTAAAQAAIAGTVPMDQRIVATDDEAAAFSLNAVNIGRDLVMTEPPPRLRAILEERGYRCLPVDLSAFVMSGGAAFCMTLRLDLTSESP